MTETVERIEQNTVGVRQSEQRSRRRNSQDSFESCNTKNDSNQTELCIRESTQIFHDLQIQRFKIDQLVKFFVQDSILSEVETEYIFGNVKLRLTYLKQNEFVKIDHSSNGASKSHGYPIERLLKWEENKKIFSVWVDSDKFFPAFQFADNKPKIIIEKVIQLLPDYMHGWQIAYWFSGYNGWLSGDVPKELLHMEDKILYAAKQVALDKYRF